MRLGRRTACCAIRSIVVADVIDDDYGDNKFHDGEMMVAAGRSKLHRWLDIQFELTFFYPT